MRSLFLHTRGVATRQTDNQTDRQTPGKMLEEVTMHWHSQNATAAVVFLP